MRRFAFLSIALPLAACQPVPDPEPGYSLEASEQREADAWLAATVRDASIVQGILTQRTLYPYHFVDNAAQLNDLGRRDLAVLADEFRVHPGPLSIRRGDVPDEIYQARVRHVTDALRAAQVDVTRVAIADTHPGGSGAPADDVIDNVRNTRQPGVRSYQQSEPAVRPVTAQ